MRKPSSIETEATIKWNRKAKQGMGLYERRDHPEDATTPMKMWTSTDESWDIVLFVPTGEYHVWCEDGSHICCDHYTPEKRAAINAELSENAYRPTFPGPATTLEGAKRIAEGDYDAMRLTLYGLPKGWQRTATHEVYEAFFASKQDADDEARNFVGVNEGMRCTVSAHGEGWRVEARQVKADESEGVCICGKPWSEHSDEELGG